MSVVAQVKQQLTRLQAATSSTPAQAVNALALFRAAWGEPDDWQQEALQSTSQSLMLNCSRQAGKSTVTSTLPVVTAVNNPGSLTLILSPSLRQSSELFNKVMHAYNSTSGLPKPRYETKLTLELENSSRILSLPGKPDTIR